MSKNPEQHHPEPQEPQPQPSIIQPIIDDLKGRTRRNSPPKTKPGPRAALCIHLSLPRPSPPSSIKTQAAATTPTAPTRKPDRSEPFACLSPAL